MYPAEIISSGTRFGRWTVIADLYQPNKRHNLFCRCECGTERVVKLDSLRSGASGSCGCERTERLVKLVFKHGHAKSGPTRVYAVWAAMKKRCCNPTDPNYFRYGGRGITVCERWKESFADFLADMGEPPPKHVLDRSDNNAGYSPDNCKWVTCKESMRNTRQTRFVEINGEKKCLQDWADLFGLKRGTLVGRLKKGWGIQKALTTPPAPPRDRMRLASQSHLDDLGFTK